jgi:hypothetical protein
MSNLRQEISESEKARSDLLKWKLIGVSALAAAGLGFTQESHRSGAYMVLPLIPLVCFYVDLLCRHESLRILVIAAFLRSQSSSTDDGARQEAAYEQFVKKKARPTGPGKNSVFAFQDYALEWSTGLLSLLFLVTGILGYTIPSYVQLLLSCDKDELPSLFSALSIISGSLGLLFTVLLKKYFTHRVKVIDDPPSRNRLD